MAPLDEVSRLCDRLVARRVMLNYNLRISISKRGQLVWLLVQGDQMAIVRGVPKKLTVAKLCCKNGNPVEGRVSVTTTLADAIEQAARQVSEQIKANFEV